MSTMHLSVVDLYTKENEIINRLKTILVLSKLKMKQGLGIYKITLHLFLLLLLFLK